jgi:putative hydrolase of the HAD superfamily
MHKIKNILFDLGGVLIDIDYHKTSKAFINLGITNFDALYTQFTATDLFEKFETGRVSAAQFYEAIQRFTNPPLTQQQIDFAWNAMLLDIRKESLQFLETIKDQYNIYLLSNTNSIHLTAVNTILKNQTGLLTLDHFFIKSYYSHQIQMRKPYKETYEFVLYDAQIKAEETLFIDDSKHNIEGAMEAGIKTHLILPEERIENLEY